MLYLFFLLLEIVLMLAICLPLAIFAPLPLALVVIVVLLLAVIFLVLPGVLCSTAVAAAVLWNAASVRVPYRRD